MSCQVFEPGGPARWGCSTHSTPELACEHAAGSSIARCNCFGRFGEGGSNPADWFETAAEDGKFFTAAELNDLWKLYCASAFQVQLLCEPPPIANQQR